MIIPSAYILFKLLKRFPSIVIVVMLIHGCLINFNTIEENVKIEKEIELYSQANDTQNNQEENQKKPDNESDTPIISRSVSLPLQNIQTNDLYCKTAFHDLYILYQSISIDRQALSNLSTHEIT